MAYNQLAILKTVSEKEMWATGWTDTHNLRFVNPDGSQRDFNFKGARYEHMLAALMAVGFTAIRFNESPIEDYLINYETMLQREQGDLEYLFEDGGRLILNVCNLLTDKQDGHILGRFLTFNPYLE